MKWAKRIAIAAGLLLAIVAVLPFVISIDNYRPRIEQEISARLKEPVTINRLRAFVLPVPHATAEGIVVGKSGDIKVTKLAIAPEVWSLLGETKVIRYVELSGLQVTQNGIEKLAALGKTDPKTSQGPAMVRVGRIKIDDATLQFGTNKFGPLDATIALNPRGEPEQASVATNDGNLKATIKPDAGRYVIELLAKSWRLPLGPALVFDELKITGIATLNDMQLNNIRASLYGGGVSGSASIAWARGIQVKGQLEVKNVDMQPLLMAAGGKSNLSGRLNASPRISANAATAAQLANVLRVEGPFNVQNGVLHGVDIQKAATNLLLKESGGQTRFDQLSGYIVAQGGAQQVTRLQVRSGSLAANGNVNVSPRKELSGRLNAQVKLAQVAAADVPLNVSGTVDSPMVLPTGAAVAGAAAGTAILGPGVGTSVGVKIGNWADGLFGRKADK
jgi:uncharacterized protein involved in outer membrane biogenesis